MATQRLSGAGKRMLFPLVLCCLWAFVVPAEARAQKFDDPECRVQSITMKGVTTWQIKGTAKVSDLIANPNNTTVRVKVVFQKKAKDADDWSDLFELSITAGASNGTAEIDTGFRDFTPAPAAGEQYRIALSGTWENPGPPAKKGKLPAAESPAANPPAP